MLNIFLIDDDPALIKDMLELLGYEVQVAKNGLVGLDMLSKKTDYDLIILDLIMPNMDGWEVLKKIRETPPYCIAPVIILSSNNSDKSIVASLRRGADTYLEKPIQPHMLLANIEAIYRRSAWGKWNKNYIKPNGSKYNLLTNREREILKEIATGSSNAEIADQLCISKMTVKNHVVNIFKKMGVSNRTEAIFTAKELVLN